MGSLKWQIKAENFVLKKKKKGGAGPFIVERQKSSMVTKQSMYTLQPQFKPVQLPKIFLRFRFTPLPNYLADLPATMFAVMLA